MARTRVGDGVRDGVIVMDRVRVMILSAYPTILLEITEANSKCPSR